MQGSTNEPTNLIRPQATVIHENFFPYVMHSTVDLGVAGFRWNTWSNPSATTTFCADIRAFYNGAEISNITKAVGDDPDKCTLMTVISSQFPTVVSKLNSKLKVTGTSFDQIHRFDVFAGLRIPKVHVSIVPDVMLPGKLASPHVEEKKTRQWSIRFDC